MTNGNDLIEFEQDNFQMLVERFAEKYGITEEFTEYMSGMSYETPHGKQWHEFVLQEYNERGL